MSELPNGWAETTLGEIAPLTYGKALIGKSRDSEGRVPVFGSSGRIGLHNIALTSRETLIVGRKGNVGAVFHSAEPCWIIDTAYYIDTLQSLNWRYLFHLLSNQRLVSLDRSTAIPGLSRDDYNKVRVLLAPLGEQGRIADEIEKQFTRLDAATAALKRVQANLKRYRASVLKAACEGLLVPTEAELARKEGRDYEPAEKLLQRILRERRARCEADTLAKMQSSGKPPTDDRWKQKYKEPSTPDTSNLPDLPEGWVWASVEQLNPAERPCSYGVLQPGPHVEDGVQLVRVGDIEDGLISEEALKKISTKIADAYPRTRLSGGEVLITLVGAIGRTAVVPASLAGANTARAVGVIPLPKGSVHPEWVEIWFRNPETVNSMVGKSHEVARMTLNLEDVRSSPVPLPPIAEQIRIFEVAERMLSRSRVLVEEIERQVKRANRLRQGVLIAAFAGQLVPQDRNDEPASALLERIRTERGASAAQKQSRRSRKEPAHV